MSQQQKCPIFVIHFFRTIQFAHTAIVKYAARSREHRNADRGVEEFQNDLIESSGPFFDHRYFSAINISVPRPWAFTKLLIHSRKLTQLRLDRQRQWGKVQYRILEFRDLNGLYIYKYKETKKCIRGKKDIVYVYNTRCIPLVSTVRL